jgi:hypothetical protein
MKRLAFLSFAVATLMAPIQVQAQQYDPAGGCVRFPQRPDPEAEIRYLNTHPNIPVCASPHPDSQGQADTLQAGSVQRTNDTINLMRAMRGYR